ncbi:hypothetical protein IAE22_33685, partial [Bacillus sp. S34]|nr:hypothetical protein [Bacillus sp. S34]
QQPRATRHDEEDRHQCPHRRRPEPAHAAIFSGRPVPGHGVAPERVPSVAGAHQHRPGGPFHLGVGVRRRPARGGRVLPVAATPRAPAVLHDTDQVDVVRR